MRWCGCCVCVCGLCAAPSELIQWLLASAGSSGTGHPWRGRTFWGNADVKSALVVAHNAVNQALLNTALDLPPSFFRRLLQSNAATSVIDFQPNGDKPPTRTIDRMNQVGADCSIQEV